MGFHVTKKYAQLGVDDNYNRGNIAEQLDGQQVCTIFYRRGIYKRGARSWRDVAGGSRARSVTRKSLRARRVSPIARSAG